MTERSRTALPRDVNARLGRTRLAIGTAMVIERGWPLVLPLAGRRRPVPQPVVARPVPASARHAAAGACRRLRAGRRWPRSIRCASSACPARPRSTAASSRPTRSRIRRCRRRPTGPRGKPDSFADALWREHQKRMAASLGALGGDLPRTGVPERDPWALRAAVALAVRLRLRLLLRPAGRTASATPSGRMPRKDAIPPRIDAWVTPPTYTGKAPIFLTADASREAPVITVPEGSDLSLRVTGGTGEETLAFAGRRGRSARHRHRTAPAQARPSPSRPALRRPCGSSPTS